MRSATDRARSSGGYYRCAMAEDNRHSCAHYLENFAKQRSRIVLLVGEALPVREPFAELCCRDLRRV